jgi:hypothetical protein
MHALFEPDGGRFVPTELTRGPWSPDAQHGGPPAALLARVTERFPGGESMQVARLTVELLRPVPLSPLTAASRLARPGRNVQLVEASLLAGNTEVARATALRIRTKDLPFRTERPAESPPALPSEPARSSFPGSAQHVAYHSHGVEHRFASGAFDRLGPAVDWVRLRAPLVAGEATTPLARVAAAADFGNGISWVLPRAEGYTFINPDLTIYLHRLPAGEWVCLDAVTWPEPNGIGLAESRLWDAQGPIGRSLQSLLLDRS